MATMKLTDRACASARSKPGKRLELWDADVTGLCLRVSDTGKGWFYRYRNRTGGQPRMKLGAYVTPDDAAVMERRARDSGEPMPKALTLANARAAARALRVEIDAGADPANDKRRKVADAKAEPIKTLADLAAAYFTACETGVYRPRKKTKRASTLAEERGLWARHVRDDLGETRVEAVTPAAVKRLLLALLHAGKGTTSNRVRALVRQLFNYAISEERVAINPVARVEALGDEMPRERVLSDAELSKLWGGLTGKTELRQPTGEKVFAGRPVRIAISLLALLLQRRAEVAGMRERDLDLHNGAWIIPGSLTKNRQAHLVPLPPASVALIREALALRTVESDYVFPGRTEGKSLTPAALSHAMRDMRPGLGLADASLHDLRRTGATVMASERLGVSPFVIGRVLNHTTETGGAARVTMQHYALHSYAPEKRAALQAWENLLLEIVGERERVTNIRTLAGAVA